MHPSDGAGAMGADEVRGQWEARTGEYSPRYYAHYGPDERSELIREILDRFVGSDAAVLELGCSSGRHLAHLHDHGYDELHGVDINDAAFDVMARTYPGLADDGTFYPGAIESVVPGFDDGRFDAVYSVETLQHLHPDSGWVFGELSRIARGVVVTVENEGERRDGDGAEGGDGGGDGNGDGDADGHGRGGADEGERERVDGRERGDGDDGRRGEKREDGRRSRGVNYVRDDFPLYYRAWDRIFADLGLVEAVSMPAGRDVLRAFREPPR